MNLTEEQFNPSTTMFVCNKWEQVPSKDKDEVVRSNNYKLRQCYPDFREDQVYYISTETVSSNRYTLFKLWNTIYSITCTLEKNVSAWYKMAANNITWTLYTLLTYNQIRH